jgi:hypothetical protein
MIGSKLPFLFHRRGFGPEAVHFSLEMSLSPGLLSPFIAQKKIKSFEARSSIPDAIMPPEVENNMRLWEIPMDKTNTAGKSAASARINT